MKKSTKEVLASVDFPVVLAKANGDVRVRAFTCKDSGQTVIANYMTNPFSPITGGKLAPIDKKVLTISEAEMETFESLGKCPSCGSELVAHKTLASELVGNEIHCIVCGEALEVDEANPSSYWDALSEETEKIDEEKEDKPMLTTQEVTSEEEIEEIPAEDEVSEEEIKEEITKPEDETVESSDEEEELEETEEIQAESEEEEIPAEEEVEEVEAEGEDDSCEECKEEEIKEETVESESTEEPFESEEAPAEEDTPEEMLENQAKDEEIRVDMLARVQAGLNSKKLEVVASGKSTLHYIMVSNKPVATLHRSRACAEVQDIFDDIPFLTKTLSAAIEKEGLNKTTASAFGLVPMILKVKASEVVEKAINDQLTTMEAEKEADQADYEEAYEQSLGMAAVGINRNAFADCKNELAEELVDKFEGVGVEDAREIVESCFLNKGEDYLRQILAKAAEFKSKSKEVRNELAASLAGSNFQPSLNLNHKVQACVQAEDKNSFEQEVNSYRELF